MNPDRYSNPERQYIIFVRRLVHCLHTEFGPIQFVAISLSELIQDGYWNASHELADVVGVRAVVHGHQVKVVMRSVRLDDMTPAYLTEVSRRIGALVRNELARRAGGDSFDPSAWL